MHIYNSEEIKAFVAKAVEALHIEHLADGVYRPLKDNIILPNGDIFDIGSRFKVAIEEAVEKLEEVVEEVIEKIEDVVNTHEATTEVTTEVTTEEPVAKPARGRKAVK